MQQSQTKGLLQVLSAEDTKTYSLTNSEEGRDTILERRGSRKATIMLHSWHLMESDISPGEKDNKTIKDRIVRSKTAKTVENVIRNLTVHSGGDESKEQEKYNEKDIVIRRLTLDGGDEDVLYSVECPNHHQFCPDNHTCCHMYNSSWGCCAMKNVSTN